MMESRLEYRLNPNLVAAYSTVVQLRLTSCLEILIENNWMSGTTADKVKQEYKKCVLMFKLSMMKSFKRTNTRLDDFWVSLLEYYQEKYANLMLFFLNIILILSHGNGFYRINQKSV
ncbi:hypothetical protein PR048_016018 [Dryococelus australis]|uniref:Uncharacterized protein n=1 Tax=Dryococelus australis TaxID=614101 RepID=A0ABQ9HIJ9_9NEOP|nr:hypothetical protein PR048_016018 [Dryococelus australis]